MNSGHLWVLGLLDDFIFSIVLISKFKIVSAHCFKVSRKNAITFLKNVSSLKVKYHG